MKALPPRRVETIPPRMGWLTTFNDMVTLLMVFFVLLFAMGTMDANKVHHFQASMQSALGILHAGQKTGVAVEEDEAQSRFAADAEDAVDDKGATADKQAPAEQDGSAPTPSELIQAMVAALDNTHGIDAVYTARGLFIALDAPLLFELGRAAITPQGLPILKRVGDLLQKFDQPLRVEGHTDNLPINTRQYPSNWELSTARAINVVKFFVQSGIVPQRLAAVGYGASKPRVANDSPAHRSRNRRVEIVLELKERQ